MKANKHIERSGTSATKIFDQRSLEVDYRTLVPIVKKGMTVLDVGCGTGSMSKDMANLVGSSGKVIGIDNTKKFIESGKQTYRAVSNLNLIHSDLFDYHTDKKFDLVTSARTLQWLRNPKEALIKMKSMVKPGGILSVLDYNHETIEWVPQPPTSMAKFYETFLKWRSDAGMNNRIADDLPSLMREIGLAEIETFNSDEHYLRGSENFKDKVGIWSKVAGSRQMVDEGYLEESLRLQAIADYNEWVASTAVSMTMKLNEVRGKVS